MIRVLHHTQHNKQVCRYTTTPTVASPRIPSDGFPSWFLDNGRECKPQARCVCLWHGHGSVSTIYFQSHHGFCVVCPSCFGENPNGTEPQGRQGCTFSRVRCRLLAVVVRNEQVTRVFDCGSYTLRVRTACTPILLYRAWKLLIVLFSGPGSICNQLLSTYLYRIIQFPTHVSKWCT